MTTLKKTIQRFFRPSLPNAAPEAKSISEVDLVAGIFPAGTAGVMVDVGAHFGESFSPFVAREWQVLAFEPDTDPRKLEAIRSQLNSQSKLFVCALSDTAATDRMFYRSDVSTGISGLIPFHQSHQAATAVEVDTLKAVLLRERVERVDFLKIDTEGNDLLVLKGLDWQVKPDVIVCEFEDAKTKVVGYEYDELGKYLLGAGYQVFMSEWYPIERYGIQHRWRSLRRYPCAMQDALGWGNYIAVSDKLAGRWLQTVQSAGITIS